MEPKDRKGFDKRNSLTHSKLMVICFSFNNVRVLVTKTITTLHYTSAKYTSIHYTCRQFTSCHLNFTQPYFTNLSFGLNAFKFPTAPFHLTSLNFTSLLFTSLLDDFRRTSIPFVSPVYNCVPNSFSKRLRFTSEIT